MPRPAKTFSQPVVSGPRRRPRWFGVALVAAVLALAGAGGISFWHAHQRPARIAAALPPLPDLTHQPVELQERMRRAHAAALTRETALAGVAELGRLCHANDFVAAADACWQLLAAEDPRDARWNYYRADLARATSDYAAMAALLTQTTESAPDYAPAWLQLADLHLKSGRLTEAERAYQQRLALVPRDPHARLGLARVALQQERRDEARRQTGQLVAESPGFAPGHNLHAELLAADGDAVGADQERRRGRDAGRFRPATDPWLEELDDWCFNYELLCRRGTIDAQTKQGERARAAFARAIQLRPDALPAYELLGGLYLELNDPEQARATYELGLTHATHALPPATYFASLSRVQARLGQPGEAVRVARDGLARAGEDADLYDALGTALGALGESAAAVAALQTAVALRPGDARASYNLAVALLNERRLDEAVPALHRSLAAQPGFPSALALLAQIEIDSGRWQSAVQYLQTLYESNPELPEAREKMSDAHLRAGMEAEANRDGAAAERHYRAGLAITAGLSDLHARLGALLLLQRRFAEAVAPLEAYHRLQPEQAQSALFLGQAYLAVGRRADARQVLTAGVQVAEHSGQSATAERCRELLRRVP